MALEKIGVGAVFGFDDKPGVRGEERARKSTVKLRGEMNQFLTVAQRLEARFGRLGRAIGRIQNSLKRAGQGLRTMGQGARNLGMGLLPMTVGLGFGVKKAADFEHQMAAVGAVVRDGTVPNLKLLTDQAEVLGIKSAFSQTKVGEAMELMGIAGANTEQVLAGIGGVTDLAAAGALDMATASDAVAQGVKIMRLEWDQATRVADVYAMASVSANTTVVQLAEAMKIGGQKARSMGIELEETVAVFSRLADAGLKGSLGGTAFTNMLVKLSKPTSKGKKLMEEWGIKLTDNTGKLKKISVIVDDFKEKMSGVTDVAERAGIASEIFGIRGERAYNSLFAAGSESLVGLEKSLKNSAGKATEMAEKRLDSLKGKVILLASSFEALAVNIFKITLSDLGDDVASFTSSLNGVLFAMKAIENLGDVWAPSISIMKEVSEKYDTEIGETTISIARGISQGLQAISDGYNKIANFLKDLSKSFDETFGDNALQKFAKWGTIIAVAGGLISPIILGFLGLSFVISGLVSIISGFAVTLSGLFLPALVVIGALGIAFSFLRKENESFGETAIRIWGGIKTVVTDLYEGVIKPFFQGLTDFGIPIMEDLGESWMSVINEIKTLFSEMFESFGFGLGDVEINFRTVGQVIATVIASAVKIILFAVRAVIKVVKILLFPIRILLQTVKNVAAAFGTMAGGNVLEGFKRLGLAIVDFVAIPIRILLNKIIQLADILGAKDLIPKELITFTEKGFTGIYFPEQSESKSGVKAPKKKKKGLGIPTDEELAYEYGIDSPNFEQTVPTEADRTRMQYELVGHVTEAMARAEEKKKPSILDAKVQMCVDGESMNVATARHKMEIKERSGGKSTPWQRRVVSDHGAPPDLFLG